MINRKLIFYIAFLIIFFSKNAPAQINNKIILKVENEIVTSYELKNKILTTLFLAKQEINQSNINKVKKKSIELLIEDKLKKIELEKYNVIADDLRVRSYLNSISSNNIQNLIKSFNENGLNFDLYKKEIETEVKWQQFIFNVYKNKINLDENIVENELKNLMKKNSNLKEFKISEIEIIDNEKNNTEFKIKEVQEEINKNGFSATAIKLSMSSSSKNKGNLGWINSKSLSKKINSIIVSMNVGDVSKPIFQQNRILFLKLDDIRETAMSKNDIEKLKEKIIDQKKNELFNLYSKSHLSKLRNISYIEFK
tara:strand:- start:1070 stop:1999 length:930 start_codon:yes stop_codon:yes gene_type:complete